MILRRQAFFVERRNAAGPTGPADLLAASDFKAHGTLVAAGRRAALPRGVFHVNSA